MTIAQQDQPEAQVAARNPWYVADQHRSQLGSPGRRRVIEYRWRVFDGMIRSWRTRCRHDGPLRILDAGCGDGINLMGLRQLTEALGAPIILVGVDYNPVRLERARRSDPRARLHRGSLYHLPFANESFDVILCNHVIEHVPQLAQTLSELVRVLRRGGMLIVGVPNEGCIMGRIRNNVIQRWIGRTTDHVHFFTAPTLVRSLQQAGLRVHRIERETFFFPCSYVNAGCNEFVVGHWLMAVLRRLFPSQAGGLIVASERSASA